MISVSKSSAASPRSNRRELAAVLSALSLIIAAAAWWFFREGYILYYGDAQAHLNISRGLIDSRTPGYDQLGTVWLPVLHLICLPFVRSDWLWSTGLAGTIPVAFCFVVAGAGLYLAAQEVYRDKLAAVVVLACFALNPNILYLAVIPMTEIVFIAGLALLLLSACRYRNGRKRRWMLTAIASCWILSLTRYDGWFLIPFTAAWFAHSARRQRPWVFLGFACAAGLAPLYWVAHNWWETGNALDFYNGPYSPAAIQAGQPYPGSGDWRKSFLYYGAAASLCAGWTLICLGIAGSICAAWRRTLTPVLFLLLTPAFYIWSMHSSGGTPIHVPNLPPFSYYNSRYGIAAVVWCAFAAGAISLVMPRRVAGLSLLLPLLSAAGWLIHPSPENWICWKESQVNSLSRRAWTSSAAKLISAQYKAGQGIMASTGDVTGIFSRAQIHLSETLNIGNGPAWLLATTRPGLFHPTAWAVCQDRDLLYRALHPSSSSPTYVMTHEWRTKDDPALFLLRNTHP